jgi:hypothetical protein
VKRIVKLQTTEELQRLCPISARKIRAQNFLLGAFCIHWYRFPLDVRALPGCPDCAASSPRDHPNKKGIFGMGTLAFQVERHGQIGTIGYQSLSKLGEPHN